MIRLGSPLAALARRAQRHPAAERERAAFLVPALRLAIRGSRGDARFAAREGDDRPGPIRNDTSRGPSSVDNDRDPGPAIERCRDAPTSLE